MAGIAPSGSAIRIAVVANTAWYLFNFRLNLMFALRSAGYSVLAVAMDDGYGARIRAAGFEFEAVSISGDGTNPAVELASVFGLLLVMRRWRPRVVLSYTPKGNLYSGLVCLASRIAFVPNVSGLGAVFIRKSFVTVVSKVLYHLTFLRARRVFFQNQDDMAVFLRCHFVRANQAERLPGSGVDLVRFSYAVPVQRAVFAPVFLLVARMLWDKGVGEYVRAARLVKERYPSARFQLLGFVDVHNPSSISRAEMYKWVAEGAVEYLGSTDDVYQFLVGADCVVLPSYREGVPRTLLEAAAVGRPIITTDVPGCRDTVIDGETGFLCRPSDAEDLTQKLCRFIALRPWERLAMGQRGRSFVEEKFDERLVIDRYLQLMASYRSADGLDL